MAKTTWDVGQTGWVTHQDYVKANEESRVPTKELGQQQFLNLLVAQMQAQDPLEPQTDTAFIAQLAQFTSLEAINSLSQSMENSSYYSMVGKLVYCEANTDDGRTIPITGYVNTIVMKNGVAYAQIGDNQFLVECSAITEIYNDDILNLDNPLVNNANLIGKTITATNYVLDDDGNKIVDKDDPSGSGYKTENITGVVERMSISDGVVYAHVSVEGEDGEVTEEKVPIVSITDIKQ